MSAIPGEAGIARPPLALPACREGGADSTSLTWHARRTVVGMDRRAEVREFLTSRRARIKPGDVGMAGYDPRRRVTGLRREEVATLAGVSIDYYVRLERGNLSGVSESILEAISRALRLTPDERRHLYDLARLANGSGAAHWAQPSQHVRPHVQQILDTFSGPAWVRNDRLDLLAANQLGAALYSPIFENAIATPNKARFVFLDPQSTSFYPSWHDVAKESVAVLRGAAGRNPYDKLLTDLIGELSTRSDEFRSLWADHDVMSHQAGTARVSHPVVGAIDLFYEALQLAADDGLTLITYGVEPGTESAERLQLLAVWTAPAQATDNRHPTNQQPPQ
jgi:transcriptional regulator with XRE-family HTH domain